MMKKSHDPDHILWYRRSFSVPEAWAGQRVLLHFGAVDWKATVWVNGTEWGSHQGGYDGFSFDITDALNVGGDQEGIQALQFSAPGTESEPRSARRLP